MSHLSQDIFMYVRTPQCADALYPPLYRHLYSRLGVKGGRLNFRTVYRLVTRWWPRDLSYPIKSPSFAGGIGSHRLWKENVNQEIWDGESRGNCNVEQTKAVKTIWNIIYLCQGKLLSRSRLTRKRLRRSSFTVVRGSCDRHFYRKRPPE